MRFRHVLERLDAIVSVDIKEKRLQLRDLAVLRHMHLRQPVDRADPLHDGVELGWRDGVGFIDYQYICVRDLEVRCGEVLFLVVVVVVLLGRHLVEAGEDVAGVDEGDYAV